MKIPRVGLEHRSPNQARWRSQSVTSAEAQDWCQLAADGQQQPAGNAASTATERGLGSRQLSLPTPLQSGLACSATSGPTSSPPAPTARDHILAWRYAQQLSPQERQARQKLADHLLANLQDDVIQGDIDLTPYPELTALPEQLHMQGNLHVGGQSSQLRKLPRELLVQGNVDATGCQQLCHLPEQLLVGGNLLLSETGITRFTSISFYVEGHLQLRRCLALELLDGNGVVAGNVDLTGCSALHTITWQHWVADATLRDCVALTALPEPMHVIGNLDISACHSLLTLPKQLSVGGTLFAARCNGLQYILSAPVVTINVHLSNCRQLQLLPADWHIQELLDLSHCTALQQLPTGLTVVGKLRLDGCTALTDLPEDLHVVCEISLDGCLGMMKVPKVLLGLDEHRCELPCSVSMVNTGLPSHLLRRLKLWSAFYGDLCTHEFYLQHQFRASTVVHFHDFTEAWAYWGYPLPWEFDGEQEREPLPIAAPLLNADELEQLVRYCNRMPDTAEYRQFVTRSRLHERMQQVLPAFGQADLVSELLRMVEFGNESCGDVTIHSLEEIELYLQVQQALQQADQPQALRALAVGLLQLEIVRRHAATMVQNRASPGRSGLLQIDEIEIYLALQIQLAERLQLPLANRTMLYANYARLEPAEVEEAAQAAASAAADPEQVDAFLQQWEPWQCYLRHQQLAQLTWQTLPSTPLLPAWQQHCCPITLVPYAEMEQPVLLLDPEAMPVLLEWQAFGRWWVMHGAHPLMVHQPVSLQSLYRLPKSIQT